MSFKQLKTLQKNEDNVTLNDQNAIKLKSSIDYKKYGC